MESSFVLGFSISLAALFFFGTLISLVYWYRIKRLEETTAERWLELAEKSEPKELQRAIQVSESSADRIDNALVQLQKFREGVHGEMQRFYGIMRRNEKALSRFPTEAERTEEEEVPTEISPEDLKPAKPLEGSGQLTKAELRRIAREKGVSI